MATELYITALYDGAAAASDILPALRAAGVQPDDICVAMSDTSEMGAFCERTGHIPIEHPIGQQLQEAGIGGERAAYCEHQVASGAVLLLIKAPEQAQEVLHLLRESGGDVESQPGEEGVRIPLHAERLRVDKRMRSDGEVRVRKVVTQSVAHVEVPVTSEALVVTRTPPDGPPETWKVPLWHEDIMVRKEILVTNEVTLRRETVEEVRHITEPVLREQLQIARSDSSAGEQISTFDATTRGKVLRSHTETTESSMDWQESTNEVSAFFSDRISADTAAEELRGSGVSDNAIRIESEPSSAGFLEGVKRFFSGEEAQESYERGAILTVRGEQDSVLPIIERYGGRVGTGNGNGVNGDGMTRSRASSATGAQSAEEGGTMKLHEERLNVQKEEAKQGEVRLSKEVVTERQEFDVPVKREEVVLNRRRVEQPDDGAQISDGEEIRIPVMREDVSVEKRPVVTEEVGVEKREFERNQHVSATVQKERARLETDGRVGTTLKDVD